MVRVMDLLLQLSVLRMVLAHVARCRPRRQHFTLLLLLLLRVRSRSRRRHTIEMLIPRRTRVREGGRRGTAIDRSGRGRPRLRLRLRMRLSLVRRRSIRRGRSGVPLLSLLALLGLHIHRLRLLNTRLHMRLRLHIRPIHIRKTRQRAAPRTLHHQRTRRAVLALRVCVPGGWSVAAAVAGARARVGGVAVCGLLMVLVLVLMLWLWLRRVDL